MRTARRPIIDQSDGVPKHAPIPHTRRARLRALRPCVDAGKGYQPLPTVFRMAAEWCLPWSVWTYPGHLRGLRAILSRAVTDRSVSYWKKLNNPPVWAAEVIRDYIRSRCVAGLAIADELDGYIAVRSARVHHLSGRLKRGEMVDE